MNGPAIEVRGLTKWYPGGFRRQPVPAVRKLDLTVERGSIVAFVGPNGAGKTTTIHTILGLLAPDEGLVRVLDQPASDAQARTRVGYQSEIFHTYPFHTAWHALQFYGSLSGMTSGELQQRIPEELTRLGLKDVMRRQVRGFSKGMTQRLGLAQALLHKPELLILDEPTSGLDPEGRKLVADIILEEREQGRTVFLSSHILSDVERVCDRVVMIRKGELVYQQDIVKSATTINDWEIEVRGWQATDQALLTTANASLVTVENGVAILRCAPQDKRSVLQAVINTPHLDVSGVHPRKAKSLEELYMEYIGSSSDA